MSPFKKTHVLLLLLFTVINAQAQEHTVTGKVTSARTGEPLPNVTISFPSLSKGVTSNEEGVFIVSLPAKNIAISVSSAGFLSMNLVIGATQSTIFLQLQDDPKKLDEVVVVGYSDKKRSELTSAVQVIDAKKLKDVTAGNIGAMLQGKVAGLQVINSSGVPGATPEIRLRGISSVNASQTPLFVVDGIIGGSYDPNDVESVTVLKDAGATAMYGSQANGGVIIITTKKAKSGKTRYEARITTGFRTPDFGEMDMMNGKELYNYQKELYRDYIPTDTGNSHKIDILKFYSERPLELRDQDHNWLTTIFKPAIMQNYYFSVSGKTEKSDYYLGLSYYNEDGTFMNTNFQRINMRGNSTLRLNKNISVTNNINLNASKGNGYDYNDIYYAYLNVPWDN
ncbi:MAG TPA: TonB-dependent receptor plug domain-containing protein, partial [Niastella sp.]